MNYIEVYQYGKLVWDGRGEQLSGISGYGLIEKTIKTEKQVIDFFGYGLLIIERKEKP